MSQQSAAVLEQLLRASNLGWTIDMSADKDQALSYLLEQLDKAAADYRRLIQDDVSFTPQALAAEAAKNPHKIRAFLQALVATSSAEMLVMVWRILQGTNIRQVDMNYQEQDKFRLVVVLGCSGAVQEKSYCSEDINDAGLVRHFGITTINGKPLFDGFFPLG